MNSPIRKVAAGCLLLCLALLVNATYVQAFQAEDLNEREGNRRVLIDEYSRERGPILVGEPPSEIALSTPVDGELGYLREYPEPETYAHATGFYSFFFGRRAIESAQNSILSGSDDRWFFRRLIDLVTGEQPRGGAVKLTLDPAAQQAAFEALGGNKGAVVALEPSTGAILAMVSKPSYDPNPLASHDIPEQQEAWDALTEDEDQPMLNRAIAETLPPGSVFKLVTAAAALESEEYEADSVVPGPAAYELPISGNPLRNYNEQPCGPDDETSITNALRISCNSAFAYLGNDLGDDALREQAERFGFNTAPLTNDDLTAARSEFPSDLEPDFTAQSAIGQYDVRTTPLQIAMVSAAIANRGVLMDPYLVDEIRGPDLVSLLDVTDPAEVSRAMSTETSRQLTQMMVEVVDDGTGQSAQMSGVQVAGKTGTAQSAPDRPPYAWFTSFAPVDNPEVAVAVVIEEASGVGRDEIAGGRLAAPVAVAVMEAVLGS